MTFGANPGAIGFVLPLDWRTIGLLLLDRISFEPAGDAWASSLRAALPMYRHDPTVSDPRGAPPLTDDAA